MITIKMDDTVAYAILKRRNIAKAFEDALHTATRHLLEKNIPTQDTTIIMGWGTDDEISVKVDISR